MPFSRRKCVTERGVFRLKRKSAGTLAAQRSKVSGRCGRFRPCLRYCTPPANLGIDYPPSDEASHEARTVAAAYCSDLVPAVVDFWKALPPDTKVDTKHRMIAAGGGNYGFNLWSTPA